MSHLLRVRPSIAILAFAVTALTGWVLAFVVGGQEMVHHPDLVENSAIDGGRRLNGEFEPWAPDIRSAAAVGSSRELVVLSITEGYDEGGWKIEYLISERLHHTLGIAARQLFENPETEREVAVSACNLLLQHGEASIPYILQYVGSTDHVPEGSTVLLPVPVNMLSEERRAALGTRGSLAAMMLSRLTHAESVVHRASGQEVVIPHWMWTTVKSVNVDNRRISGLPKELVHRSEISEALLTWFKLEWSRQRRATDNNEGPRWTEYSLVYSPNDGTATISIATTAEVGDP